jgi:glycosyltransferase involved in cell wall biosynthesis
MLKIVHITNSGNGGAGIAAYRVHKALQGQRADSKLLVLTKPIPLDASIEGYVNEYFRKLVNFTLDLLSKLFRRVNGVNTYNNIDGDYEGFTTPISIYRVENHPWVISADIIHLHWISDFINYTTFFEKISHKKIVWTFHDLNPFMGGFHFQYDKNNNPNLQKLEKKILAQKVNAYKNLTKENFCAIYLNSWIKNRSLETGVFNQYQNITIPNCIDFSLYQPYDKNAARSELGITHDDNVIMFVCAYQNHKRKGVDEFQEAVDILLNKHDNITILNVGQHIVDFEFQKKIINLGMVNKTNQISRAYSAADLVVIASIEDNLPNVMLEAWACGTPVVSFNNGGMIDHIISGLNGEIVETINGENLAKVILECVSKTYNEKLIIEYAKNQFSPEVVAKRLLTEAYIPNITADI